MSSSEEDGNKFKNDLDMPDQEACGEFSSGSESDSNEPRSMFSVLKPFHVPGESPDRRKDKEESETNETDMAQGDPILRHETNTQGKGNVRPPVPPRPKSFLRKSESMSIQPDIMPSSDTDEMATSRSSERKNSTDKPIETQVCPDHDKTDTHKTDTIEGQSVDTMEPNKTTLTEGKDFNTVSNAMCPPSLQSFVVVEPEFKDTDLLESSSEKDEYFDSVDSLDNEATHEQKEENVTQPDVNIEGEGADVKLDETQHQKGVISDGENTTEDLPSLDSSFIVLAQGSATESFVSISSSVTSEDIGNFSMSQCKRSTMNVSEEDKEKDDDKVDDKVQIEESKEERDPPIEKVESKLDDTTEPMMSKSMDKGVVNTDAADKETISEHASKNVDSKTKTSFKGKLAIFENLGQKGMIRTPSLDKDKMGNFQIGGKFMKVRADTSSVDISNAESSTNTAKCEPDVCTDDVKQETQMKLEESFIRIAEPTESKLDSKAVLGLPSDNDDGDDNDGGNDNDSSDNGGGNGVDDDDDDDDGDDDDDDVDDDDDDDHHHHHHHQHHQKDDDNDDKVEKEKEDEEEEEEEDPDTTGKAVIHQGNSEIENSELRDDAVIDTKDESNNGETEKEQTENNEVLQELSHNTSSLVHSKSAPVLDDVPSEKAEAEAPTPPPRPPKRQQIEPEQQSSFVDPMMYQQNPQGYANMPGYYQYPYQSYPQQYMTQPMQPYQYDSGNFQYMYPNMGYYQGYAPYTSGFPQGYQQYQSFEAVPQAAADTAQDQQKHSQKTETKKTETKETNKAEKSGPKAAPRRSLEKSADSLKVEQSVRQKETPIKKERAQKVRTLPKSPSLPSRLDQRIPKDRHQKAAAKTSEESAAESPVGNKASGKKTSAVSHSVEDTSEISESSEFYLFVSKLGRTCTESLDNLTNYIEAGSGAIVIEEKSVYDDDKAAAVLVLTSKPDMDRLRQKIATRPLDDNTIGVCEIESPMGIVVSCEDDLSTDDLMLYFESSKSGGGETEGHPRESEDQTVYVVNFQQQQVVQSVCAKESHVLSGRSLKVSPYYQCELGAIWDTRLHALPLPEPETIPLKRSHAQYLAKHCEQQLGDHLKEEYCDAHIRDTSINLSCTLVPGVENFRRKLKTWSDTVCPHVKSFLAEHVSDREIDVDHSMWDELLQFINSDQFDKSVIVVDLDQDNTHITLTGSHETVVESVQELEKKRSDIDRKNRRMTMTKPFDSAELALPAVQDQIKHFTAGFCDAEIKIDEGKVNIIAVPEDTNEIYVKIYQILDNVKKIKVSHKFSKACVEFVNRKPVIKSEVDSQIENAEIEANWKLELHHMIIKVSKGDPEAVQTIILDRIKETEIKLSKSEYQFMQTSESVDFLNGLTVTYDAKADITDDDSNFSLVVYGMTGTVDEICNQLHAYVDENAMQQEYVRCEGFKSKFFGLHGSKTIIGIQNDLKEHKVEIRIKDNAIEICASKKGMSEAKQRVRAMLEKIVNKDWTIQKVNVVQVMQEAQLIEEAERETRCVVVLQKEYEQLVKVSQATSSKPEDVQLSGDFYMDEKVMEQIKTKIVEGEIAKQTADVIVVAVSPDLNLKSGAASRNLLQLGGESLQEECKQRYPDGINHGGIAVIGGGNINCSKVYLTCLKQWSHSSSESAINKIVTACLEKMSKYSKTSICFAAMGTGQLKYPARSVARAMFQSVQEFSQNNPQSSVKEVMFALHPKDMDTIKAFKTEEVNSQSGYVRPSVVHRPSKASAEVTVEQTKMKVVVESLEKQQVDCVLVGTNEAMNLDKSGAGKALAKAAGGTTLLDECKNKHGGKLGQGEVAEIGSGKLPCKSVFLTVLKQREEQSEQSEEHLVEVLQSFLQKVEAKKYSSVAIPALGTGYLKYPKTVVCSGMFRAVMGYAQQNPQTCIKEVRFVMFSKDHDTIEVFQNFAARKANASKRDRNFYGFASKQNPDITPKKEPKYRITSTGCHIRQICLRVQVGDIIGSDADGIVSSCTKEFELTGAVAGVLKRKYPPLEDECKKKSAKFTKHGLAMIGVKKFPFKNIIFVQFQESLGDWKKSMIKCLEKANEKKWKSVSFPVLGSGQGFMTFKPECIAVQLYEAIDAFSQKNPKCTIRDVRLVVFHQQPEMMPTILTAIHQHVNKSQSLLGKIFGFLAEKCPLRPTAGTITAEEMSERKDTVSSMSMTIYSDNTDNIKQCQDKLNDQLEKSYINKKIDKWQELIKSLSQAQVRGEGLVQKTIRKDLIEIPYLVALKLDDVSGVITVYGRNKDVLDALDELNKRLRCLDKDKYEQEAADMMYEQVKWHYEEATALNLNLEPYDKRTNYKIETAYKGNEKMVRLKNNDGETFVIDFDKRIEYLAGEPDDQVRVVRKDILKSMGAALPEHWVEMKENIKLVQLQPKSPEYTKVEKLLVQQVTGGTYTHRIQFKLDSFKISKVERIQNRTLYQQYCANKKKIDNEKTSLPANMPVERQLWHGTNKDASSSIISHGFNRSYCGKNGTWFGEGVYFAKDASYSARGWLSGADQGQSGQTVTGYIFWVNVLTGQYCKGVKGMRHLDPIDSSNPRILYDSAVDDVKNPMEFLIFTDTQSYPEYLITFTAIQK